MDMRKRKLYQRLSYSDVEKAGIAWEKARARYPSRHPAVEAAGQTFSRRWKDFQSIAAKGETPAMFLRGRSKRRKQFGSFIKRGI